MHLHATIAHFVFFVNLISIYLADGQLFQTFRLGQGLFLVTVLISLVVAGIVSVYAILDFQVLGAV